jgi:hypothetical protein
MDTTSYPESSAFTDAAGSTPDVVRGCNAGIQAVLDPF